MSGPDTRADEVTPAHAADAAEAVPAAEPDLDAQSRTAAQADGEPTEADVDRVEPVPAEPATAAEPEEPAPLVAPAERVECAEPAGPAEQPEAAEAAEPEALSGPLPEAVRMRVISVAADALGTMTADEVPGPLRRFARFTHQRRAKYAATPLAAALENDPVFRQRIAERFRKGLPEISEALEAGKVPAAADPLDVATAAYLLRPAAGSG